MTSNPPKVGVEPALAPQDQARYQVLVNVFGEKFAESFQGTYIVIPGHVVHSPTARRFWIKDFAYLSRQMYYEYQYRTWHGFSTEILDRYATIVTTKLSNILTAQTNWLARLQKVLEQHGKSGEEAAAMFPRVGVVDVPIIASQARMYLDVLKQLDSVHVLASTTNLWGLLDSEQRAQMEFFCKRAVRAFRVVLQNEVIKLYREAQRVKNDQHAKGEGDERMDKIVAMQGDDIKQFEKVSEEDRQQDGALNIGEDAAAAGKAIDDAAALAKATATAAQKRTRSKKAGEVTGTGLAAGAEPDPATVTPAA